MHSCNAVIVLRSFPFAKCARDNVTRFRQKGNGKRAIRIRQVANFNSTISQLSYVVLNSFVTLIVRPTLSVLSPCANYVSYFVCS